MANPPRNGSAPSQDPRHLEAAELLANGNTQRAVGRKVGVSERTIRQWLEKTDFQALVEQFRATVITRSLGRLRGRADHLISKLLQMTDSSDERIALAALRDALDRAGVSTEMELRRQDLELKRLSVQVGQDLAAQLGQHGWLCAVPEGPEE